jgi:hypothetical protein
VRQFWTSGPSTRHHTNTLIRQEQCCFDICQAMKGTHIEMSQTPLTHRKKTQAHTLLTCSCCLCKNIFYICGFFFISYLSQTPSTVPLPYSSQHLISQPHEPVTWSSSENKRFEPQNIFNKLKRLPVWEAESYLNKNTVSTSQQTGCAPITNSNWSMPVFIRRIIWNPQKQ